ncbi:MAG: hypothetical protein LBG64_03055 [Pseudomonadales bacterium]|jgi:hypothetical protein|nr:hypothetical protein [Pseudomonadales bacterium]
MSEHSKYIPHSEKSISAEEEKSQIDIEQLEARISTATPKSNYGIVSLTTGKANYIDGFKTALRDGSVDAYIDSTTDLTQAYVALDSTNPENTKFTNHRSENLTKHSDVLAELLAELEFSEQIDDYNKKLYIDKIKSKLHFCDLALALGTPEFTQKQMGKDGWEKAVDLEKTLETGQLQFPYLELARQVITTPTPENKSSLEENPFTTWNFSKQEIEDLGGEEFLQKEYLLASDIALMFNVLLKRAQIDSVIIDEVDGEKELENYEGWKIKIVEETAMSINAGNREIKIPKNRKMNQDEFVFNIAHELLHALRGIHGKRLNSNPLQTGVEDYLDTEEGLTANLEMILGEYFGHPRQKEFAARYYMAAKLSEVKWNENSQQYEPAHSIQDVYDELIEMGVPANKLDNNFWRTQRGTSLKRQIVDVNIAGSKIPMVETYMKDMVYFRGQNMVYEAFLNQIDFVSEDRKDALTARGYDFNERLLIRIGYEKNKLDQQQNQSSPLTAENRKAVLAKFAELGRDTLINLLDDCTVGKIRMDMVADKETRENKKLLEETGEFISFRDFLTART